MAMIMCKMCGGALTLTEGSTIATCEYCGTTQTVPNADNDKKLTLFGRANRLRAACDFDKAAGIYEAIVAEYPAEAEAYWGLVLCKYGIEYVDDPKTSKKIPTCHRSSFDSVMEDSNLEQAIENADVVAQKIYRAEAKAIEALRQGILEVSSMEAPYDIFICYKETDENGERTLDSVIAQDIYEALTDKGYRVFFSRISLEHKLGMAYEPYIFAALNSAKIMLAVGTCYEHYNAVWVKNEWSRYLKICSADKSKHLIPCYRNLDAYDMPKEFQHLQGQDMGKLGAIQDLLWGIKKYIPLHDSDQSGKQVKEDKTKTQEQVIHAPEEFGKVFSDLFGQSQQSQAGTTVKVKYKASESPASDHISPALSAYNRSLAKALTILEIVLFALGVVTLYASMSATSASGPGFDLAGAIGACIFEALFTGLLIFASRKVLVCDRKTANANTFWPKFTQILSVIGTAAFAFVSIRFVQGAEADTPMDPMFLWSLSVAVMYLSVFITLQLRKKEPQKSK